MNILVPLYLSTLIDRGKAPESMANRSSLAFTLANIIDCRAQDQYYGHDAIVARNRLHTEQAIGMMPNA